MIVHCICFDYTFHPVGQGLFSSGCIYRSNKPSCDFLWVYDCGTASGQPSIDRSINDLEVHAGHRNTIDILTLSHFDKDHISGVARLLSRFRVEMLLLPYMPLWRRLIIAFQEGIALDDPLFGFFLNPAAYLTSLDGEITRIVFVLPSNDRGPPILGFNVNDPPLNLDELTPKADYEDPQTIGDERGSLVRPQESVTEVRFLRPNSAITLPSLWEFVPYNDANLAPANPTFSAQVSKEADALRDASATAERESILNSLKSIYDQSFGKSAVRRNLISLFLYSGPIYGTCNATGLVDTKNVVPWPWLYPVRYSCFFRARLHAPRMSSECSILYSGDGYLNNSDRLDRLVTYLSQARVNKIGVFQVMHHGAKGNWHRGVAARIHPKVSVFSSDPLRPPLRHPHEPVLRDFRPYGPVQVDETHGKTFPGWLLR